MLLSCYYSYKHIAELKRVSLQLPVIVMYKKYKRVFIEFLVLQITTRVGITVHQHRKCFI